MPDIDTPSTPPTNIAGKPEVAWLVLDTAPLVDKNMSLLPETKYSKLYTIPEVIEEVRDEEARIHLNNLMTMGRITIKQPDEEAMSRVREFSRLTGDLHALSAVDLKVLALTWMLEKEAYSGNLEHLRAKPVEPRVYSPNFSSSNASADTSQKQEGENEDSEALAGLSEEMQSLDVDVDQHEDYYCCEDEARSEQDNEYEEEEDEEEEEEEEFQLVKPRRGGKFRVKKPETVNLPGWTDSDEGGWITPDNVAYVVNNSMLGRKKKSKKKTLLVACMTSDFAMQNVLLQMKLKLVSINGVRITRLKSWVLRCHACFKSTKDMDRKFCPSCGNSTLIRTSIGIDKDGNTIYYLKKNFQYNNRGTKYTIPIPKGGRKNSDLILREDSREYQKGLLKSKSAANKKKKEDLFDPDYVPLDGWGRWGSAAAGPQIGYGRRNVNQVPRKKC